MIISMKRVNFLKTLIRYMLLTVLALIVFALGNKIVSGRSCSGCPGNGICNGKTDCSKF